MGSWIVVGTSKALLFIALTTTLYVGTIIILGRWNTKHGELIYATADYYMPPGRGTWAQYHEFDPDGYQDVLILGSSHAYRGYDPFAFQKHGYTAFNLGCPSQATPISYVLLKHYAKTGHVGLVVLDVFESTFSALSMEESGADLIANLPDVDAACDIAWHMQRLSALNQLIYRLTRPKGSDPKPDPYYRGLGFGAKLDTAGPSSNARIDTGSVFKVDEERVRYLRKCIDLCQERRIPIVLVQHYNRLASNREKHEAMRAYMHRFLAGTDVCFLDFAYSRSVRDPDFFFDHSHLNMAGAHAFSEELIDTLVTLDLLHANPSLRSTSR
jgi:hypothetical protein